MLSEQGTVERGTRSLGVNRPSRKSRLTALWSRGMLVQPKIRASRR